MYIRDKNAKHKTRKDNESIKRIREEHVETRRGEMSEREELAHAP